MSGQLFKFQGVETRAYRSMLGSSLRNALLAVAVTAATSAPVLAQSGEVEFRSGARPYVTTNEAGLVVVIDRETGKARGLTAQESAVLAAGIKQLLNQSTDGLVQMRRADGSVSVDLQGRFQSVMLARKEDDGTLVQACVDTPEAAAAFFDIDPALLADVQKRTPGRPLSSKLETR